MSEEDKNLVPPEEQKAEEEATKEVIEDELREKLAEELGIDLEKQSDLLDKFVEREKLNRERLSTAIKQKRTWREKALKTSEKPKENPKDGETDKETPDIDELIERRLKERFEERDLEGLDLPDDLKAEIKDFANAKGISVREAAKHPYIQYRKGEIEKEERIKAATPKRSGKGAPIVDYDPSKPLNPADFDLSTEEGRKAWQEAKEARAKHRVSE